MAFKWRDSYSCNIAEIDDQHKKLFEIGTRIFHVASLKDDYDHYDEILAILDELREYTIYHFNYEEDLMKQYGYENYENHKIEHDFFVKKLQRIGRKDIEGAQSETILEIIAFVADWVSNHILKADFQYRGFFSEKGVF